MRGKRVEISINPNDAKQVVVVKEPTVGSIIAMLKQWQNDAPSEEDTPDLQAQLLAKWDDLKAYVELPEGLGPMDLYPSEVELIWEEVKKSFPWLVKAMEKVQQMQRQSIITPEMRNALRNAASS